MIIPLWIPMKNTNATLDLQFDIFLFETVPVSDIHASAFVSWNKCGFDTYINGYIFHINGTPSYCDKMSAALKANALKLGTY